MLGETQYTVLSIPYGDDVQYERTSEVITRLLGVVIEIEEGGAKRAEPVVLQVLSEESQQRYQIHLSSEAVAILTGEHPDEPATHWVTELMVLAHKAAGRPVH